MSFMMAQWQAMQMVSGRSGARGLLTAKGAAYAGSLFTGMTLAGAAALQLKSVLSGKDLQDQDLAFWIQAMQYGGGLSLAGDFVFADVNRFGQSPIESFLGPTVGLAKDLAEAGITNTGKLMRGEKTKFGRSAVNLVGRYMPWCRRCPTPGRLTAGWSSISSCTWPIPTHSSTCAPRNRACSAIPASAFSGGPARRCRSGPR